MLVNDVQFAHLWQRYANSVQHIYRVKVYSCVPKNGAETCRTYLYKGNRVVGCGEFVVDRDFTLWGRGKEIKCPYPVA